MKLLLVLIFASVYASIASGLTVKTVMESNRPLFDHFIPCPSYSSKYLAYYSQIGELYLYDNSVPSLDKVAVTADQYTGRELTRLRSFARVGSSIVFQAAFVLNYVSTEFYDYSITDCSSATSRSAGFQELTDLPLLVFALPGSNAAVAYNPHYDNWDIYYDNGTFAGLQGFSGPYATGSDIRSIYCHDKLYLVQGNSIFEASEANLTSALPGHSGLGSAACVDDLLVWHPNSTSLATYDSVNVTIAQQGQSISNGEFFSVEGTIYRTDYGANAIFRFDTGSGQLTSVLTSAALTYGIRVTPVGDLALITTSTGLYKFKSDALTAFSLPPGSTSISIAQNAAPLVPPSPTSGGFIALIQEYFGLDGTEGRCDDGGLPYGQQTNPATGCPVGFPASPAGMTFGNDVVVPWLTYNDGLVFIKLGASSGAQLVFDPAPGPDTLVRISEQDDFLPTKFGDVVLFNGYRSDFGEQLFATDGSTAWPITRAPQCTSTAGFLGKLITLPSTGEAVVLMYNGSSSHFFAATKGTLESTRYFSFPEGSQLRPMSISHGGACSAQLVYNCFGGVCSTDFFASRLIINAFKDVFYNIECLDGTHYLIFQDTTHIYRAKDELNSQVLLPIFTSPSLTGTTHKGYMMFEGGFLGWAAYSNGTGRFYFSDGFDTLRILGTYTSLMAPVVTKVGNKAAIIMGNPADQKVKLFAFDGPPSTTLRKVKDFFINDDFSASNALIYRTVTDGSRIWLLGGLDNSVPGSKYSIFVSDLTAEGSKILTTPTTDFSYFEAIRRLDNGVILVQVVLSAGKGLWAIEGESIRSLGTMSTGFDLMKATTQSALFGYLEFVLDTNLFKADSKVLALPNFCSAGGASPSGCSPSYCSFGCDAGQCTAIGTCAWVPGLPSGPQTQTPQANSARAFDLALRLFYALIASVILVIGF